MSRKPLHVMHIDPPRGWQAEFTKILSVIDSFDSDDAPWEDGLDHRFAGEDHIRERHRLMTRGRHAMRVSTGAADGGMLVSFIINSKEQGTIEVPYPSDIVHGPKVVIAHLRRVIARTLSGIPMPEDRLDLVEQWSLGLAAAYATPNSSTIHVSLPTAWTRLDVYNGSDRQIPFHARRRLMSACPRLAHLEVCMSDPHTGHSPYIQISPFSRMIEPYRRSPALHSLASLDEDPIATIRALNMVLDEAGLKPEDLRP